LGPQFVDVDLDNFTFWEPHWNFTDVVLKPSYEYLIAMHSRNRHAAGKVSPGGDEKLLECPL
jgi:hypothetical protein